MDSRKAKVRLIEIAEPVVAGAGYELVDLQYRREQRGWVVRVFIDHPIGHPIGHPTGITFEDCEAVSRQLSPALDVQDPLPHAYTLEVSSPGIDRPLRTVEHFRQAVGKEAKVVLSRGADEYEGRRNYKGIVKAVDEHEERGQQVESVAIEIDGQTYRLRVGDIASASLVPDWNSLM